jgi:hypothetical protein
MAERRDAGVRAALAGLTGQPENVDSRGASVAGSLEIQTTPTLALASIATGYTALTDFEAT